VQRLRLGAAVHSLLESGHPVTRIALDSGFASHSHLTASCTRSMGLAPTEIRRLAARPN
jgi:transcriptional regulator GlxA family with amidase domain